MAKATTLVEAFAAKAHTPALELKVRWDGVTFTDESAYVVSANGTESMDDLGLPHARSLTVVVDNSNGRYTAGYASSPIYAWTTRPGQAATLRLGYDGFYAQVGTYVLRRVSEDDDERTATLTLSDAVEDFAGMQTSLVPTANMALAAAASALCVNAGLGTAAFAIEALAGTAQFAYASKAGLLDELWQIAIAEGGRVYLDEAGVLRVQSRANRRAALQAPVATLTASAVAYRSGTRRAGDIPNRVLLGFDDRTLSVSPEKIFSLKTAIALPAAVMTEYGDLKREYTDHWEGTVWKKALPIPTDYMSAYNWGTYWGNEVQAYTLRPEDLVRWQSNIPADLAAATLTVAANTKADGSGTAIVVNSVASFNMFADITAGPGAVVEHYWSGGGGTAGVNIPLPPRTVYLWNTRSSVAYVTQLDVSAKVARSEAAYEVVRQDDDAIVTNAGKVVERAVRSSYLPDAVTAAARAADILTTLAASRASIDVPDIDGVPFLRPGDAFTYVNDAALVPSELSLQVIENRWTYSATGGYTASLVTIPALDSATRSLTTAITAPLAGTPSTVERTGPFSWAAAGTPLYWSEGTWS